MTSTGTLQVTSTSRKITCRTACPMAVSLAWNWPVERVKKPPLAVHIIHNRQSTTTIIAGVGGRRQMAVVTIVVGLLRTRVAVDRQNPTTGCSPITANHPSTMDSCQIDPTGRPRRSHVTATTAMASTIDINDHCR